MDRKECSLGFDVYYIAYVTKKPKYGINSVNPLYIKFQSVVDRVAKVGSSNDKYLLIDSVDVNKKAFEMFDKLWKGIKDEINDLISDDEVKFGTDVASMKSMPVTGYARIRFTLDIDLPYNTSLTFHALKIVIRCVIEKGNKFYPQIYLEEGLFDESEDNL